MKYRTTYMNNDTLKKIWAKGITYEEYLYLCDSFGEGNITVPFYLVDLDRLRKTGFLDGYQVTKEGLDFLGELNNEVSSKESFEEFWGLYPIKDAGSGRELRHSYLESLNLYAEAANEFGHENLMESLRQEIAFREATPSKFKYMKGIVSYLTSKEFKNLKGKTEVKSGYGKAVY